MKLLLPALLLLAACSEPVELEWKKAIGAASVSTPLVTSEFVAFGHERGLMVLETSGAPRCSFDARGEVIGRPATDGKLIYFGGTDYVFYAIDMSCKEVWRFQTRDRIKSDACLAGGRVYTTSYDGHVYALDATGGKLVWTFPVEKPGELADAKTQGPPLPAVRDDMGDFSYSSPLVEDGVLYVGNLDGHLYALAAESGELLWRFQTGGAVTSSPKLGQGLLFFGSNDGNVYAIDPVAARALGGTLGLETPNVVRWRFLTRDWVNSSPALFDGALYVGSNDRNLYALDAASGALRWKVATKGPVVATPAVYKNLVFAAGGSGDGTLYAVERTSGSVFWQYASGGKIEADPVVAGDRVYVTGGDQFAYAFVIKETVAKR